MSERRSMAEEVLGNPTQPSEQNDPAVVKHSGPQLDPVFSIFVLLSNPANTGDIRRDVVARQVVEMFAAMKDGRKIDAIKILRQLSGLPLKNAKDIICGLVPA